MSNRGGHVNPTADQVALAVVTACRLTQEDPLAIFDGRGMRARAIAASALRVAYPEAGFAAIGRATGYGGKDPGMTASASVRVAQRAPSWIEAWLDEVVGALVADDYGEQAA